MKQLKRRYLGSWIHYVDYKHQDWACQESCRIIDNKSTLFVYYALFWLLTYENNNNENSYIEAQDKWSGYVVRGKFVAVM